jgi:Transglutaminase-like superfamily
MATKPSTIHQQILDFYKVPGAMTSAGKHMSALEKLPNDPAALVAVVQGLAVHEYVASDFYGFAIPERRKSESHIRSTEQILDRIFALNSRPLVVPRDVEERLVGVCHHFVVLLTAMLRAKGVPARARYGFGAYFNPGFFEDHSICEYWNAAESRWVLADPQFDDVWRQRLRISHDVLDVPRDRFLVGADAWAKCRAGETDASKVGIFRGGLRGMWFIAGVLLRDLAALNKMEMLQWDVWGAMPRPDESMSDEQLAFFDQVAALTRDPDESFGELRSLYETDDGLRVPPAVFNAVLNRPQAIAS